MLINLISPFKKITPRERALSTAGLVILLLLVWSMSATQYFPSPRAILGAFPRLLSGDIDIVGQFGSSLAFCFSSMFYAICISLIFCYLSVLPLFSTLCAFIRKFRFLPSVGLSFLFMKMTGSIEQQKSWMMVFGVTTWLVDSMIGIALSINDDDVMYARSLRLSRWQTMKELLIFGKAAELFGAVVSNFAMAWMLLASIENLVKSAGGIGVVMAESSKYYRFDEVYAIQILILLTGITIDAAGNWLKGVIFPYTALKD